MLRIKLTCFQHIHSLSPWNDQRVQNTLSTKLLRSLPQEVWNLPRVRNILAHVDHEGAHGEGALDEEVAVCCSFSIIFARSPHENITLCPFLQATLT